MSIYIKNNRLLNNKIKYKNITINTDIIKNHINDNIINRLQNKNPNTDRFVYSSQDPYANGIGQFIRNSSCWINGISNISCFSPAQLSGAAWNQRAGTLITKKHIILGKHFVFSILQGGTPLIFVDENNNVIRRNVIEYAYDDITDIAVGLLDNEVPNNIKIAKVLPTNYQNYIGYPTNILAVSLDQQEKAILKVWDGLLNYVTAGGSYQYSFLNSILSNDPISFQSFTAFSEDIVVGDSGNPSFLIIDNELVLLCCWHTPFAGPFVTNRYNKVNELIQSLSPNEGYSLTPINLDLVYHKYS